jgi:hypothetical protein
MFLSGTLAALAEGCSHTWMTDAFSLGREAISGGEDLPMTRADIDRIGYASLAVRMGTGKQALLILSRIEGDDLLWVSHDRELIVTRRGRVVRTYGLPQDLDRTRFVTADPVEKSANLTEVPAECVRSVDFGPEHEDGIFVRSRFLNTGFDDLAILGRRFRTSVWEEKGAAPEIDWEFTNAYWFDSATGYVWKSIQHTAPNIPPLELIVFKPPSA